MKIFNCESCGKDAIEVTYCINCLVGYWLLHGTPEQLEKFKEDYLKARRLDSIRESPVCLGL